MYLTKVLVKEIFRKNVRNFVLFFFIVYGKKWEEIEDLKGELLNIKKLGFVGFENKVIFFLVFLIGK